MFNIKFEFDNTAPFTRKFAFMPAKGMYFRYEGNLFEVEGVLCDFDSEEVIVKGCKVNPEFDRSVPNFD